MFQHLLLGIDDSPSGEVAVDFAISFAQQCSASVHVLHVNEYLVGGRGITLHTREEATKLITTAVEQLREVGIHASGSSCAASYREVASVIADTAHQRCADAIILGSRRRRVFGSLFSPQVRERTIRLTALPVLAAPSPLEITGGRAASIAAMRVEVERYSQAVP